MPPTVRGRRRFHRKTRNGCSNCKARRVRCDETRPWCYVNPQLGAEMLVSLSYGVFDVEDSYFISHYQSTIPNMRIMQRYKDQVIEGIAGSYFSLAWEHEVNWHAYLSLAGTFHSRSTGSVNSSREFALRHRQAALQMLQEALTGFCPQNADSLLAASMNLSNQSENW